MNCPSRVDETLLHEDWNQNPPALAADITTRQDLNGIANSRRHRGQSKGSGTDDGDGVVGVDVDTVDREPGKDVECGDAGTRPSCISTSRSNRSQASRTGVSTAVFNLGPTRSKSGSQAAGDPPIETSGAKRFYRRAASIFTKYVRFIGPGFLVAVAYIDPGNYSTDVAAGATFRFRLLFIVLMSNIFAIFLQSLCIKLGTVTGLNLAEHCRAHLPRWLNIGLYLFGEAAIIATDMAEVIGSAIALNLLLKIPLVAGCALTLVDVLVILLLYNPSGSMRRLRAFEYFVMALVLGVVVAFCFQLSYIEDTPVGDVFRGYLPSSAIVKGEGLYLSCGILGATVMPHSLYLGSGIVQARLLHFDRGAGKPVPDSLDGAHDEEKYRPSLDAIRFCLNFSIIELATSLFTFALFVNSSILIVAGASLYRNKDAQEADLFSVHELLSRTLAPVVGTIFALALLLSGTSAGIVCTIAGQILSEGALNWKIAPWLRRLITRAISIIPSIIIAAAVGRKGISAALTASQVALSLVLPFVSAPIIYFTSRSRFMTVPASEDGPAVNMRNHWITTFLGVVLWLVISVMNVALLVLLGLGKA